MTRIYPLLFCLFFLISQLSSEEVAGIDLDSLERPSGVSLNSQEILQERSAKRSIREALRLIDLGKTEAKTEDRFSKLMNRTVDKSDVRRAGEKKIEEGEVMLVQAAETLKEIYSNARKRAKSSFEAEIEGLVHEWTSTDGRTLSASLISMTDDNITVKSLDGVKFVIPLKRLIKTDWLVAKILDAGRGYNATGFLQAVASGNPEEVQHFIESGFEPPREIHGEAFLESIAMKQSYDMLRLLIKYGLNVNAHSADGVSPLSLAVQAGKLAAVRILLTADADPMLADAAEPELSPIVWSLHELDPVITTLLFMESKERLGPILSSLAEFVNTDYFKPISLEKAKRLQEAVDGKKLSYSDSHAFKLSLLGFEMTISDLEKVIIAKELRPLVISYHKQGFYRHTIRRNQEFIRSLIELWEQQHEAGEHAASYSLALAYLEGWGGLEESDRAKEYLTAAIKAEHAPSMILKGEIFEEGLLGETNAFEAYNLYRKAAALSDPMGMVKLGHCFENGISVDQNLGKAISWYERAIENGSTEGMAQLGRCYLNGIGVGKNASLALEWYSKAAETNNPSAMFFLGEELLSGEKIRKNANEGLQWLKRAAEFGELDALVPLGIAYTDGTVRQDLRLANSYFKEAAERGNVEAMYLYANNLRDGGGVAKNEKEAFKWYEKAAEENHLGSIYQLAVCYSSGKGVRRDQKKAFKLFKKASSRGHMQASANLAVSYAKGLGVAVDEEEATRLSLEVINSNDASAKEILSLLPQEK